MPRTVRVWFCPCCRWSHHRAKSDDYAPYCVTCGASAVSGFGYKESRRCLHVRNRAVIRKFDAKMGARVRTQTQRVLRPSAETKRLWREIRAAKTRPAIERRAQPWLDSLLSDSRDAVEGRWTRKMSVSYATGRATVQKHRSTYSSTPTVARVALRSGLLGDYRRGILSGHYGVRLSKSLDPTELRRTLVHEALHVLDSEADLDDAGHGMLWRKRLAEMERYFPPLPRGTL